MTIFFWLLEVMFGIIIALCTHWLDKNILLIYGLLKALKMLYAECLSMHCFRCEQTQLKIMKNSHVHKFCLCLKMQQNGPCFLLAVFFQKKILVLLFCLSRWFCKKREKNANPSRRFKYNFLVNTMLTWYPFHFTIKDQSSLSTWYIIEVLLEAKITPDCMTPMYMKKIKYKAFVRTELIGICALWVLKVVRKCNGEPSFISCFW